MAVMFSVPFDFNLYSSWYAVGVFDKSRACDYDLYYEMYNNTGNMFTREIAGKRLDHKNGPVAITATMTVSNQPILSLEVRDNLSKRTEMWWNVDCAAVSQLHNLCICNNVPNY